MSKTTDQPLFVCDQDWVVERNRHNDSYRPYLVAQLDRYRITYGEHTGGGPFFAAINDSQRRYVAERIVGCVKACRGIDKPEGVPAVLEALRAFVNLYGAFTERLSPKEHTIVTEGRAALYALDNRE